MYFKSIAPNGDTVTKLGQNAEFDKLYKEMLNSANRQWNLQLYVYAQEKDYVSETPNIVFDDEINGFLYSHSIVSEQFMSLGDVVSAKINFELAFKDEFCFANDATQTEYLFDNDGYALLQSLGEDPLAITPSVIVDNDMVNRYGVKSNAYYRNKTIVDMLRENCIICPIMTLHATDIYAEGVDTTELVVTYPLGKFYATEINTDNFFKNISIVAYDCLGFLDVKANSRSINQASTFYRNVRYQVPQFNIETSDWETYRRSSTTIGENTCLYSNLPSNTTLKQQLGFFNFGYNTLCHRDGKHLVRKCFGKYDEFVTNATNDGYYVRTVNDLIADFEGNTYTISDYRKLDRFNLPNELISVSKVSVIQNNGTKSLGVGTGIQCYRPIQEIRVTDYDKHTQMGHLSDIYNHLVRLSNESDVFFDDVKLVSKKNDRGTLSNVVYVYPEAYYEVTNQRVDKLNVPTSMEIMYNGLHLIYCNISNNAGWYMKYDEETNVVSFYDTNRRMWHHTDGKGRLDIDIDTNTHYTYWVDVVGFGDHKGTTVPLVRVYRNSGGFNFSMYVGDGERKYDVDYYDLGKTEFDNYKYLPATVEWKGDLGLECGDVIKVVDESKNEALFPIMAQQIYYDGGVKQTLTAYGSGEGNISYLQNNSSSASELNENAISSLVSETIISTGEATTRGGQVFLADTTGSNRADVLVISQYPIEDETHHWTSQGKVVMIDKDGIKVSNNGYNGTYTTILSF